MSSHVPFLAVRPDDQFSTEVKTRDFALSDAVEPSVPMDSLPPLTPRPGPPAAVSSMPKYLRFPLVVVISFSLNLLLHTLTSDISGFQLATASRQLEENWQVGAFLVWKLTELSVAWVAEYGYEDLAALTLLTNQPYYYLLHSFWSIQLIPVIISLTIDVAIIAIPFALLRPLTRLHDSSTAKTNNQALAMDWQIMGITTVLGASIYAVTFYLSYYAADLSVFLISHFDDIPSMEMAHEASIPKLMQIFIASGFSAMAFLLRPTLAAAGKPALTESKGRSKKPKKFHPETATLSETFAYNLGYGETGWSHRAEVLAKRTLVLVVCTLANTLVRVFGTVQGTDVVGSLGYAGLWAAAHVMVGVAFGWLGNEQ